MKRVRENVWMMDGEDVYSPIVRVDDGWFSIQVGEHESVGLNRAQAEFVKNALEEALLREQLERACGLR